MSHSVRVNRKSVSWLEPRNWWFKKLKRYNENFQFPLRYLSLVQKLSDFINQKNDDSHFRLNECRNECLANLKSWKSETYFEFSVQRYFRQIAPRVMCCVLSWKLFHFKMPGSEGIWSNCATILPRVRSFFVQRPACIFLRKILNFYVFWWITGLMLMLSWVYAKYGICGYKHAKQAVLVHQNG